MQFSTAQTLPSALLSLLFLSQSALALNPPAVGITAAPMMPGMLENRQDNGGFTPTIDCYDMSTWGVESCSTITTGANAGPSCTTTQTSSEVCKATNICATDDQGIKTCMMRDDSFSVDQIIITIFLAICFAGGLAVIGYLCVSDRRADRRRKAAAEAAAIAKESKMAAAAPPTISEPPAHNGRVSRNVSASTYGGAPQNPFAG